MKIYYLFRFTLLLLFIFITISAIRSFIPAKLSNDPIPAIIDHTETFPTSIQKEPIYITSVVLIDPVFSDLEVNTIKDALNKWVIATNGIVQIFYERCYYPTISVKLTRPNTNFSIIRIRPALENNQLVQLIDEVVQAPIVGYADMGNISKQDILTVYIVNGRIDSIEEYSTVVQHEFAHATLKMLHLSDHSIMAPGENYASPYITQTDLKYFCYLYNCDAEQLHSYDPAPMCSDTTFHLF